MEVRKLKINGVGNHGGNKYLKFLIKEGKESNVAVLEGDILPSRCDYTHDNRFCVMPHGGPLLIEGEPIPNQESKQLIKKIHYDYDLEKYLVEIKEEEV